MTLPADGSASKRIEEAWRLFSSELLHFARYRVSDAALAEDLIQEAFLRLHRVSWPKNVRGWLFRVVRNLIVDHWRARITSDSSVEELVQEETSEVEQARWELGNCLPKLLERLPEGHREALILADLQELPQRLIADRQQLSLSGAKSRVQRARRLLHKSLEACCLFDRDHAGRVIGFTPKMKINCVFSPQAASSMADINQQEQSAMKQVMIEWHHLDVDGETCERCSDTGAELHDAIGSLNRECAAQGIYFTLRDIPLEANGLEQSNAIYIDSQPIEALLPSTSVGSSACSSCGTLVGSSDTTCRTLTCGDTQYESIPAALIREAACRAIDCCQPACGCH